MAQEKKILLQKEDLQRAISRMAHEMIERNHGMKDLVLIGIRSRGAHLVRRIARKLQEFGGISPPLGVIDVTPYRDDRKVDAGDVLFLPTEVPVAVDDKTVVLVDDVIYRGRTVRAALDRVSKLGKPKKILLAILIDRGERELPIRADIVGKNVGAADSERVNVLLEESDGIDQVTITVAGAQSAS